MGSAKQTRNVQHTVGHNGLFVAAVYRALLLQCSVSVCRIIGNYSPPACFSTKKQTTDEVFVLGAARKVSQLKENIDLISILQYFCFLVSLVSVPIPYLMKRLNLCQQLYVKKPNINMHNFILFQRYLPNLPKQAIRNTDTSRKHIAAFIRQFVRNIASFQCIMFLQYNQAGGQLRRARVAEILERKKMVVHK